MNKNYFVNFGNGIGRDFFNKNLAEVMTLAEKEITYNQCAMVVLDDDGDVVARLPWWGVAPEDDDVVTSSYGSFGFYGEWEVY